MKDSTDVTLKDNDTDDDKKNESDGNDNITNKGRVIFDATACPQAIAYPTDLDLLSTARKKSEKLMMNSTIPSCIKRNPEPTERLPANGIFKQPKKE